MTVPQIREFLGRLASPEGIDYNGLHSRCDSRTQRFAKKILKAMHIPEDTQKNFLELCDKHDGYCDCEILMNAASSLLGEETSW